MPVQQQMSSFAGRLGGRVAQANAEHRDKPIDTGNRRLPAGIKSGIAKLSTMYTKQQTEEKGRVPKGETFFRASAVVEFPVEHGGMRTKGMITQVIIPLCDIPKRGQSDAKSFSQQWFEFQNLFKMLGVPAPNEPGTDEAAGRRIEAYYFAAMKALTDPQRPGGPVYIEFSTRGWTPPKTPQNPNPDEMVFETWHGLADTSKLQQHSSATAANEVPSANGHQSEPFEEPPQGQLVTPDTAPDSLPQEGAGGGEVDVADEIASLVEVAMNDPEGATTEGAAASARLEELAWANGWTKEQTAKAKDWTEVGDMALEAPQAPPPGTTAVTGPPAVGSKHKFCKRAKDGSKLKNSKGEPFPPKEVEVVSVNAANKTCNLKYVDGSGDVVDMRSKKPVDVKFEWLE